ncbi:hypothetical protein V2J09_001241 [Rumex salicifolius]
MSSTLHQLNPSPYNNNNNKCHQGCFAELLALPNPVFPNPLWDPIVDHSAQVEDFAVPDSGDMFSILDNNNQLAMGFQLPVLHPECNTGNYFSGGAMDEPGFVNSDYFMGVADNGPRADFMIQDYGTNFSYEPLPNTSWQQEVQSHRNQQASTPNIRVGRYSVEERRDRILRYLKKRNQRNFNKTIKYACRKTLADRRVRVRGRFAKNNEEVVDMKRDNNGVLVDSVMSPSSYYDYADDHFLQMKQDGEEWLHEALSSLMYNMAPYNYVPQWQQGSTGLPLQ